MNDDTGSADPVQDLDPDDTQSHMAFARTVTLTWCRRHGVKRNDWEDCQQEASLAMVRALKAFDPSMGSLKPFAYTCVRNALVHWRRQQRRKPKTDQRVRHQPQEDALREMDLRDAAERYLSPEERTLLQQLLAGLTPTDIARERGCTKQCVWCWRRTLVRRLRSILND
jgi:RNA polymerase sigma factor (sigma-70 family)